MHEEVWVSNALGQSELVRNFSDPNFDHASRHAILSKYFNAEPLLPSEFPSNKAYLTRLVLPVDPLPHLMTNSFMFLSRQLRDLLLDYDLGLTSFSQVALFGANEKKLYSSDYYFINIAEVKGAAVIKKSIGLRPYTVPGKYSYGDLKDDTIAVNAKAFTGVDLWMEPTITRTIFFSGRLYHALQQSGLAKDLNFARCVAV